MIIVSVTQQSDMPHVDATQSVFALFEGFCRFCFFFHVILPFSRNCDSLSRTCEMDLGGKTFRSHRDAGT